mmetsp:Transcript_14732/g.30475  ORF Transcript_14732/g.30475 Transcript_14732/m.30475 type:complete len:121 (+) Transcript_14732:2271-2633(+)
MTIVRSFFDFADTTVSRLVVDTTLCLPLRRDGNDADPAFTRFPLFDADRPCTNLKVNLLLITRMIHNALNTIFSHEECLQIRLKERCPISQRKPAQSCAARILRKCLFNFISEFLFDVDI